MNRLSKGILLSTMVASQLMAIQVMAIQVYSCLDGVVTSDQSSGNNTLKACIDQATNGDTITFADDMTIVLSETLIIEGQNIAIDGGEHKVTLDGNGSVGVLGIYVADVNISNLTIQNGNAVQGCGGIALYNSSAIVSNSTISGNTGSNGGGIYGSSMMNPPSIIINNSTISGNTADVGGGISSFYVNLQINNSTISGNTATDSGGGIYAPMGTVTLNHATITENNSTGLIQGIMANYLTASNSIISGNGDGSGDFILITSEGHNLLGNPVPENMISKSQPSNHKLTPRGGVPSSTIDPTDETNATDPLLAPLGDNGGTTLTHMPLADSPAIGKGTIGGLEHDQIGTLRSTTATIGAVEYIEPIVITPEPEPETNTTTPETNTTTPETNTTTPETNTTTTPNAIAHYDVGETSVSAEGIPGATAVVDAAGNNVVTATVEVGGITYAATIVTTPSGATTVTIKFTDGTTGGTKEFTQTLPVGVTIVASMVNGQLVVTITVKSDEPLVIE